MLSRRRFLGLAGASIGAGLGVYTWGVEPQWLEVVRRALPIRKLPGRLAGRTLVHLSDIHVGPRVADDYVLAAFRRTAALDPDLVVITGDFISHHPGIFAQVRRVYRECPRGRIATAAVLGNHDYGPGWAHPEIAAELVDVLQSFGMTVLRNEIADAEGLQIAGLDDWWAGRFDAGPALRRLDPDRAAIVLSHNPDTADLPVWNGYEGWILSGHTHGGQCKPPFLPPPLLPVRNRRYTAGEIPLSGNRRLYISRGIGHLLAVRFNVRPEITAFELTAA